MLLLHAEDLLLYAENLLPRAENLLLRAEGFLLLAEGLLLYAEDLLLCAEDCRRDPVLDRFQGLQAGDQRLFEGLYAKVARYRDGVIELNNVFVVRWWRSHCRYSPVSGQVSSYWMGEGKKKNRRYREAVLTRTRER